MANDRVDCDHDSAFGDDELHWTPTKSMFPVAGTKRDADDLRDDAQAPSIEVLEGNIDPAVLCCSHCPETCPERTIRPVKRRASAQKVGEFHSLTATKHTDADCQFPDDCFEAFCQECNLEPICPPDCVVSCPSPECAEEDVCFDPSCTKDPACTEGCADPACTKKTSPENPCFCQKCDAQPCPLGDPNNECHLAHSAPTPVGTVYCYDNAPCHFQEGYHTHNNGLEAFESYPCFSQSHAFTGELTASSAPTPALSQSNYTSLESIFTGETSPGPSRNNFANCFLNSSGDHCHIDNSCCHGSQRACGECPSASPNQLDLWTSSIAQGNGLANNFMGFNFHSQPTSPMSADRTSMSSVNPFTLDQSMMTFNDQSWMLPDPAMSNTFPPVAFGGANKLDFLASAVQQDILGPSTTASGSMIGTDADSTSRICKWYVF